MLASAAAFAASPLAAQVAGEAAPAPPVPPCTAGTVPALTPVVLATTQPLGTKLNKSGDLFKMVLVEPIVLGDCQAVPAGASVTAEVIQSKKSEFWGGTGGEFIAAARFMEVGDRRLRLRSLTMRMRGADHIVWGVSTGTGYMVLSGPVESGKKAVEIPKGAVYEAKTAEAFDLAPPPAAPPPAAQPADPAG